MTANTPVLYLTDGTTKINLLGQRKGWFLKNWNPAVAEYKDGGSYASSGLSDGRRLVHAVYDNTVETFTLALRDCDQDEAAERVADLRAMVEEDAPSYWKDKTTDDPIYLVAKAANETNRRYAIIHTGKVTGENNPFAQPFFSLYHAAHDDVTLVLERGHWQSVAPGSQTAVSISAVEEYDLLPYGNVNSSSVRTPTTAEDAVYVANKRNVANLTHVYVSDTATLSTIPLTIPFTLTLNSVGDYVAFGIDITKDDSGPFDSLVMDILTAIESTTSHTVGWEYWSGAAWSTLTVQDNTSGLSLTGIGSVHWEQPSGWATTALGGVTAFWVRVTVLTLTGTMTSPIIGNRQPYTVVWPYFEVQASEITGDMDAIARIKVKGISDSSASGGNPDFRVYRMLVGLRSVSRGEDFTAYINLSDEQNGDCFTVSESLATTSFVDDVLGPTGRALDWSPVGAVSSPGDLIAQIIISPLVSSQFYGSFRAFLRCRQVTGSAGNLEMRLRCVIFADTHIYDSGNVGVLTTGIPNSFSILDMGQLDIIPGQLLSTELLSGLQLNIRGTNNFAGARQIRLYDLVLIPVDEWSGDFQNASIGGPGGTPGDYIGTPSTGTTRYLDIDSLAYPRLQLRAPVRASSSEYVTDEYQIVSYGPATLRKNARQRFWFLSMGLESGAVFPLIAKPGVKHSVQVYKAQRYKSARGVQ